MHVYVKVEVEVKAKGEESLCLCVYIVAKAEVVTLTLALVDFPKFPWLSDQYNRFHDSSYACLCMGSYCKFPNRSCV